MARQNKDSKFIIYQVLYIFVVTVLALKGAGLDLGEVVKLRNTYETLLNNIEEAKEIIADGSDQEMVEMAKMEMEEAQGKIPFRRQCVIHCSL